MSQYIKLMLLLLFFLSVSFFCKLGFAEDNTGELNTVPIFVAGRTDISTFWSHGQYDVVVSSHRAPSIVAAEGMILSLASADLRDDDKGTVGIVAEYIETKGNDWVQKLAVRNGTYWKSQLVLLKKLLPHTYSLNSPAAVMKGKKIYVFAVGHNTSRNGRVDIDSWHLELAMGKAVPHGGVEGADRTIMWRVLKYQGRNITTQLKGQSLSVSPYGGFSLFTEDENVVFIMRGVRANKSVSVIIRSNITKKEENWDWSFVETPDDCYSSSFFVWEGRLIMVPAGCRGSGYKVKESTDMGRSWSESNGPISRLWDNFKSNTVVTVARIGNKNALLFTQRREKKRHNKATEISLWLSDGKRLHEVGVIVADDRYVTSRGLVYTKDELFSLHQIWVGSPANIFLLRLKGELEKIKSVLNVWDEKDKMFLRPCTKKFSQHVSSGAFCATRIPTDGLVGFLSNTSDTTWCDEYLYVNATVRGGNKVNNGFTFTGLGAGARWKLDSQEGGGRYNFSRHGLTVVATVVIDGVPENDIPLLTFGGGAHDGDRPGLFFIKNRQWRVLFMKNGEGVVSGSWETSSTYRVVVTLHSNTVCSYVDGEFVGGLRRFRSVGEKLFGISDVFIGGYEEEEGVRATLSNVTVTNVLLYNRVLRDSEIVALGGNLNSF